jgi:hypothetical protein
MFNANSLAFDANYLNLENYAFDANYLNLKNYVIGLPVNKIPPMLSNVGLVTISSLNFESGACVTNRRKFIFHVSSLSVLILPCSCVKTLVGKKSSTANSRSSLYNRLYSRILELCSRPFGQPQGDKRG